LGSRGPSPPGDVEGGGVARGYHPAGDIVGAVNRYLGGQCVVLGVTASVSLYRSLDLARWLLRRGARVRVVMTEAAADLVSPFEWATGEKPVVSLGGQVEHVRLARECDSMIVAPATLSTMSKIAWGTVDNPVALTAVSLAGTGGPVLVVPAMHGNMMESPAYREAASALVRQGYVLLPPKLEEGVAKYPDVWLVGRVAAALTARGRDLEGQRVLVTAGATREWIDDVRFISNPSSGFMGVDVAVEAWARGAEVDLVYGHVEHPLPHMVNLYHAETTEDMADTVRTLASRGYDIVVAAAAPADYRPRRQAKGKLRSGATLALELEPTPKVLDELRGKARRLVAFAAEAVEDRESLVEAALAKMSKYGAHVVVANRVGRGLRAGFSSPHADAVLVWRGSGRVYVEDIGLISKEELSRRILDTALLAG